MSQLLKYDVIYILNPNSTTTEIDAVAAKVEQIVADGKGTVLKKEDWGKRRLAYLVAKHREGHYVFYHLSIPANLVAEVTRNLRLLEKVIKFTIVKDTISHLKPKPRPVRTSTPRPEGTASRAGSYRPVSAPVNPSPVPQATPAPAPAAAPTTQA